MEKLIQDIRALLAEGKLEQALENLLAALREHPDDRLYNEVVLLNFQHHEAERHLKLGMIETDDYFSIATRVSNAVLTVILEELAKPLPVSAAPARLPSSGKLLHNIPGRMTTGLETRCTVRIAPDEAKLLRDFETTEDTVVSDIELAKIMEVHVFPENDAAFKVRTFSSDKQVISTERANEWKFLVTPLLEGRHRLLLKVMVIEVINEQEYRRDTILEREVEISSDAPPLSVSYSSAWEYANVSFIYARAAEQPVPVAPGGSGGGRVDDDLKPSPQSPPPPAPYAAHPDTMPSAKRSAPLAATLFKVVLAMAVLAGAAWLAYTFLLKKEAPPPGTGPVLRKESWAVFVEVDPMISPQTLRLNGEPVDFHRMSTSRWRLTLPPEPRRFRLDVSGLRGSCSGEVDLVRDSMEFRLDCQVSRVPAPLHPVLILTRLPDPQILVDGQVSGARFRTTEGEWKVYEMRLPAGRYRFLVQQGTVSCFVVAEVSEETRVSLPCALPERIGEAPKEPPPPAPRNKTYTVTVETRESAFAGAKVLVDQTNYGPLSPANGVHRREVSGLAPGPHRFILLTERRMSCVREVDVASDQVLVFSDCTPVMTLVVKPPMKRPLVKVNGEAVSDWKLDGRNREETRILLPLPFRAGTRVQLAVSEGSRNCGKQVSVRDGQEVVLDCKEDLSTRAQEQRTLQINLDDRARRASRLFRVVVNDGAVNKDNLLPAQGSLRLEVPLSLVIGYVDVFGMTGQGEPFLLCRIKPGNSSDNPMVLQCSAIIID